MNAATADWPFKEILQDFGNEALYLLPQSQMNSWILFVCLAYSFGFIAKIPKYPFKFLII